MAEVALHGQALLDDIAQTQTAPGQVAFWWLGQHSFILKGGATVGAVTTPPTSRRSPPWPWLAGGVRESAARDPRTARSDRSSA